MYDLLGGPVRRTKFSDAAKAAIGGFRIETGVYWRLAPKSIFVSASRQVCRGDGRQFNQRSRAFGHGHFGVGFSFLVCETPARDG